MTEADKKIYYRPELAKTLERLKKLAIKIYQENYKEIFFRALSKSYENENPELAKYLNEIADVLLKDNGYEIYMEQYKDVLIQKYDIPKYYIIPTYQIKSILDIYKIQFDAMERTLLQEYPDLTKQEEYMVKSFMRKISAPTRDPNFANRYYEKNLSDFYKYVERHAEYIERECSIPIEIFNTPDEKEKDTDEEIDR